MKIAVTATGQDLSASTDPRFGRAEGFIIYDTESKGFEYVSNTQNAQSVQGAGIQSAKNVIDTGATVLLTGNIGPKAYTALNAAEIEIYLCPDGTVENAVRAYQNNELEKSADANVSGHWGGV